MNKDDIMRMASEAGGLSITYSGRWMFYAADLERFAHLVAAAEREAWEARAARDAARAAEGEK